ncbi:MAG: RNA polymerase sigma factor [Marinifilaceae bacterium]
MRGPQQKKDDQELLQDYLDTGNLETLGSLYQRYMHLVYGVCLKYFHNREEGKDAVNKIFELLITEIPKFEIQNFRSWLYVVTKNHCLMELRKHKSEKSRMEKYSEHFLMESTDLMHPIDEAPDKSIEAALKKCMERLKQEQRECIQLFYYEELCYQQIAENLQLPQKRVKSYIQNGKRNLKICLEHYRKENEV